MINPDTQQIIDIHLPLMTPSGQEPVPDTDYDPVHFGEWGRTLLAEQLLAEGADAVTFSRGSAAFNLEAGTVEVLRPNFARNEAGLYIPGFTTDTVELQEIGAIRNTSKAIGGIVPELNAESVRDLVRDRWASRIIMIASGAVIRSSTIRADGDLDEALAMLDVDEVVVMPRFSEGAKRQPIYRGTKQEISELRAAGNINTENEWVIDGRLEYQKPRVTGRDAEQKALLDNAHGEPLVRIYSFGDESNRPVVSAVARVQQPDGRYKDVFIGQDSVPSEMMEQNDAILAEVKRKSVVDEVHVAIDFAETADGVTATAIHGAEPRLVHKGEGADDVATNQARMLARQLIRVAAAGQNK